jgi:16S rRNA processing protein RimM
MTEYFKIGKIVSTFGLKGEVVLKHNLGKKTSLKGLKALFVEEKKESFIPWFVEAARIKNDEELFVKFDGVDTKEAANKLAQKEAWMAEEDFKKFSSKSSPINLLGYTIVEDGEVLGTVLEVIEQPNQVLCRIEYKGKEALIPLHEDSLIQIDRKNSRITVELPPGLLEIYL